MQLFDELTSDLSAGMWDSVAPTRYPQGAVAGLYNARIQPDGTARRRWGSIRTHAAALNSGATGYGGTVFTAANGTVYLVVFVGNKAYKSTDYGATCTQIATGLRQDYYSVATMREGASNYLFAANGDTTIKQWDGTTWGTVSGAPSGVKYAAVFNGRLYATGHSGILVQASAIGDHTNWTSPDGITLQLIVHSGDIPTGMVQVGDRLLVFTADSTAYIDGFGQQDIIVAAGATGVSRSVGCVSFRTITPVGDDGVCWLSKRGVEYYTPSSGIVLISKPVQGFLQEIDFSEIFANPGRATAAFDAVNQDYLLALSTNGTRNDRTLVLNIKQQVLGGRSGAVAAASIDQPASDEAGTQTFSIDADGYLVLGGGGGLETDADGYLKYVTTGGDALGLDADSYLVNITNDTLPATFFMGPSSTMPHVLYSVGYDGFVRMHYGVDTDDTLSTGTGGADVEMVILSKPFLYKRPVQKKRVRRVQLASMQDAEATITVYVKGGGRSSTAATATMPVTLPNQAYHTLAKVNLDAFDPQVELRTTDDCRVVLLGTKASLLRERAS